MENIREIGKIVIHCTASPDSLDIGVREVRQWHIDRGWTDIGYHILVRRSGVAEAGRSYDKVGAHVAGHNSDSLGIVWVGQDQIAQKQMDTLLVIVRGLMHQYNLSVDDVYGHYELDSKKTCPNLDMNRFRAELLFTKVDDGARKS